MVLAETVLWVHHSSVGAATALAPVVAPGGNSSSEKNASLTPHDVTGTEQALIAASNAATAAVAAASHSLALLDHRRKKCAIYSIDIHPAGTIFATAGGDGTVRLWNAAALFGGSATGSAAATATSNSQLPPSLEYYCGKYREDNGTYVSTSSGESNSGDSSGSSSSSNDSEESSHEDENGSGKPNSENNNKEDTKIASKKHKNGNRRENSDKQLSSDHSIRSSSSSSSSSLAEGDVNHERTQEGTPAASREPVHDLNQFVRRKKDGSAAKVVSTEKSAKNSNASAAGIHTESQQPPLQQQQQTAPQTGTDPLSGQHHHHHRHHGNQHHRLLCTLSAHTGSSVLAVRFSCGGNYLASAGDDGCVCIYAPADEKSIVHTGNLVGRDGQGNVQQNNNNNNTTTTPEHWTRIKLCRGHGLDVVGLAWSPDDSYLVSCSLDSETPIIVWKLTDLAAPRTAATTTTSTALTATSSTRSSSMICNPFKILGKDIHTSTVKGVTFDPAGSYLASSGDDPAVCIWRAHDDWGLEKRIDASSGIFRRWNQSDKNNSNQDNNNNSISSSSHTAQALSSQSLFRRISWSTDGAFVCSTNSVVKNKHVVSTISREGWCVSTQSPDATSASSSTSGAANLVGHKQPVVVSRHAPQMLNAKRKSAPTTREDAGSSDGGGREAKTEREDDEDDEPDYATLLALGDKMGFVTVWSTRKAHPIFKLQCSENRCTVTDLAWGTVRGSGDLILLISMLDGQVSSLRFSVPGELGRLLTPKEQARVFELRYGIEMDDAGTFGQRKLIVGESSGPKLIENTLQMSLEEQNEMEETETAKCLDAAPAPQPDGPVNELVPRSVKDQQKETTSLQGKKRVRPVLVNVTEDGRKRPKASSPTKKSNESEAKKSTDPMENAMEAAKKASAAAGVSAAVSKRPDNNKGEDGAVQATTKLPQQQQAALAPPAVSPIIASVPHNTDRVHSVDLPVGTDDVMSMELMNRGGKPRLVAECTNVTKIPPGSKGGPIPCTNVTISRQGKVAWRDQIAGASCSALAASRTVLAVGTSDGCIQLYGTSPTLGWSCNNGFRSHPPIVMGHAIVSLQIKEGKKSGTSNVEMLVVTGDGTFGVYRLVPVLALKYKGSIMPAMTHMSLGAFSSSGDRPIPKLSRIQITESGRLLLLLSLQGVSDNRNATRASSTVSCGVGGSLQAFVYDKPSELWMRISDSRFVLSDFYSSLPILKSATTPSSSSKGTLSRMDDSVRMGASDSSLKASYRGRANSAGPLASSHRQDNTGTAIYNQAEDDAGNYLATRSHCEDRMACAVALGSDSEFQNWLLLYVRTLSLNGQDSLLRMVVDLLLGTRQKTPQQQDAGASVSCWWLSSAPNLLTLDRKQLIRSVVIPEMSKNRALQRITNEIALEIET